MNPLKGWDGRFHGGIARYGLPIVILIYYASASLNFGYTPDSTFLALQEARGILEGRAAHTDVAGRFAEPLWVAVLSLAGWMRLEYVLAAKVLGLLGASCSLLFVFLIANEFLLDRLLALCATLAVGVQWWLLQVGPSGSALNLLLLLSLACLFFLLRNEYILASFFAALSALVTWQAAFLIIMVMADAVINTIGTEHRRQLIVRLPVVFGCTILPWLVLSATSHLPVVPSLVPVTGLGFGSQWTFAFLAGLFLFASAGSLASVRDRTFVRSGLAPWLWIGWLISAGTFGWKASLALAMPLIVVYAFVALRRFASAAAPAHSYVLAVLLTGLLLVQSQVEYNMVTRKTIEISVDNSEQLTSIAFWLRSRIGEGDEVLAPQSGILAYYGHVPVRTSFIGAEQGPRFIVGDQESVSGYSLAYEPERAGFGSGVTLKVWEKNALE